jgi:ABC-2 type transport system ATP-binding protein
MFELRELHKRFGRVTAVGSITARISPGSVTGLIGPNGAGKSTTLRMIVGLDRPTAVSALVNGVQHIQRLAPLREIGVLLEAKSALASRRTVDHLRWLATPTGFPAAGSPRHSTSAGSPQ